MQRQRAAPKIVLGVTGGLGSGKTTACRMFRRLGAEIIDADRISRRLLSPRTGRLYRSVVSFFGSGILKQGRIDRKKLAALVFTNRKLLRQLNAMMHPEIIKEIRKAIKVALKKVVVLDAPLLLECGLHGEVDKLAVVKASPSRQARRVKKRSSLQEPLIQKIVRSQMPLCEKLRLADFIIDNNGTREETSRQVKQIWEALWRS